MNENKIKEQVWREMEEEAAALERKVNENPELDDLDMPEGSFEDLMARIHAAEGEKESAKTEIKTLRIRKRTLLAVALVAILLIGAATTTTGAKLFVPKVENRGDEGELSIKINNAEEVLQYSDITEEEAYKEIEEKIGILALRLGYKPSGMELGKVFVDAEMGEAQMEFYLGEHILTVYENKQHEDASFGTQPDGVKVDTAEIFHLGQEIVISEMDKGDEGCFYRTNFEYGNAYYHITCDIELEEFKNICMGIIFDTM